MDIKMFTVTLEGTRVENRDIPKIRGYLSGKFPQYVELHNHLEDGKLKYGYPVIQYKSINGIPNVIAINDASKILVDILYDVKEVDMKDKVMSILEKGYVLKANELGVASDMIEYEFITPWLALNQDNYTRYVDSSDGSETALDILSLDNYTRYVDSSEHDRAEMLKKILVGNILSMAKGLECWVDKPVEVRIKLRPVPVNYKNKKMVGFKGSFLTNFIIPEYLGLGKSVSKGFGTVVRAKDRGVV